MKFFETLLPLAEMCCRQKRREEAILTLNEAVELMNRHGGHEDHPWRVRINTYDGIAIEGRKEPESALVSFEECLAATCPPGVVHARGPGRASSAFSPLPAPS